MNKDKFEIKLINDTYEILPTKACTTDCCTIMDVPEWPGNGCAELFY